MGKGLRIRALAALSGGLVAVCLAASSVALAAPGGNSANAKLCQQGGWQVAQTAAGAAFASQGACVSYGGQGGTVFAPSITVDPTHVPEETDSFVTITGFHPSSTGTLTFTTIGGSGGSISFLGIPTDADGNVAVFSTVFTAGACANGVTGTEISFEDAFGVHASAIVTLDCP